MFFMVMIFMFFSSVSFYIFLVVEWFLLGDDWSEKDVVQDMHVDWGDNHEWVAK